VFSTCKRRAKDFVDYRAPLLSEAKLCHAADIYVLLSFLVTFTAPSPLASQHAWMSAVCTP